MLDSDHPSSISNINDSSLNKTHAELYTSVISALENYKKKYHSEVHLSNPSCEELCMMIEDFANFPLGNHILITGGASGFWTDYIISPQEQIDLTNLLKSHLSVLESFILFHSPVVKAQRELFNLSKKTAQNLLRNNLTLASIPCGVMRDLLSLEYSGVKDTKLVGIDLDPESILHARQLANKKGISNVQFFERDAWKLNFHSEFDYISSIGLNMYEPHQDKVIDLYRQLYQSLKPGGVLFTGVLTWPPYISEKDSDWNLNAIHKFDLYLEKVIHKDLLDIKWFNFRKLSEIHEDFEKAGFRNIEIVKDSCIIFPGVIAKK